MSQSQPDASGSPKQMWAEQTGSEGKFQLNLMPRVGAGAAQFLGQGEGMDGFKGVKKKRGRWLAGVAKLYFKPLAMPMPAV